MTKYLFANIGGSDRAAIADDATGKISIIYSVNGLWFFNELVLDLVINPASGKSSFEGYCERFHEISQTQFTTFISPFQNKIAEM